MNLSVGKTLVALAICTLLVASRASASVIPITAAAFGPGSTLTTFTGLAQGTEVNGLTVNGLLFGYSLGNGQAFIDLIDGPGDTNNLSRPDVVGNGATSGVLSVTLPGLASAFGYGYALATTVTVTNATTIALFNGATAVGTLSYTGVADPVFAGGFAGISSTDPFNRVQITFNTSATAPGFALDNIRTIPVPLAVPEPVSMVLLGSGLAMAVLRRRVSARR